MLREVYVIADGLNLFYYSVDGLDENFVKSNLTSGFLSAIQSFSLEARESEIEYFESKDEYFLFTPLIGSQKMLICVFNKTTNRAFADTILKQIWEVLLNSHLVQSKFSNTIDAELNQLIRDKIEDITQKPFDVQHLSSQASRIFETEGSISSLRLLNIEENEIYFENARPKPLLKENQVTEFNLLVAAIDKLSERLGTSTFEFMLINCPGAIFSIFKRMKTAVIIFSSGIVDEANTKLTTLKIFETSSDEKLIDKYKLPDRPKSIIVIGSEGSMASKEGEAPLPMIEIFLSTVLNALGRFVSSFIRKSFEKVLIHFLGDYHILIQTTEQDQTYKISIY